MTSNHRITRGLYAAASAIALAPIAPAANAQEAPKIEEVIVTAQKREERLQDVPVSVAVVAATQLDRQNISSLSELGRAAPSLMVSGTSNGGSNANLSIRGVSTNGFARSSESAVSVVLDGVVLGRAQINTLFDIERVEVLSGPQGMLFGKNASAGVVNVVTKAPDPTEFEAIAHVDYGNYEFHRDRLTLNMPVTENSALRVGAHYGHSGGVLTNTLTGEDNETERYGARARYLWKASENLSINLIGDYEKTGGTGMWPNAFGRVPAGSALESRLAACGIVASPQNEKSCPEAVSSRTAREERYGASAQVDYVLANNYVITSITANRWGNGGPDFLDTRPGGDPDILSQDFFSLSLTPFETETFSQELRLTSPGGQTVEFVAGLYYSDTSSKDQIMQAGTLGAVPSPLRIGRVNFVDVDQRSYAAFGQATIHATEQLSFTVGARYTDELLEDKTMSLTNSTTPSLASLGFIYLPSFNLAPIDARETTQNVSWRLGAQYNWTPDIMTYVTAARGYKGPAVNDQASPPIVQPIIKEEIPMYYEAGLKAALLDGRALATVALFHNKVKNFQTAVFNPPTAENPVPGFAQGNAPYMVSKGVEVNISGRPADGLLLNAGLLYNDAEYSPDFLVACAAEQTRGVGTCSPQGTTKPVDQVAGTPKWRSLLDSEYSKDISGNWAGFVQANLEFQTGIHLTPTPNPISDERSMDDRWMLGARIGARTIDGRYEISLWGRNLLDNDYYALASDPLASFYGGGPGTYRVTPSPDRHRTYGISLGGRF